VIGAQFRRLGLPSANTTEGRRPIEQLREAYTQHVEMSIARDPADSQKRKRPQFEGRNTLATFDENTDLRDPDKRITR